MTQRQERRLDTSLTSNAGGTMRQEPMKQPNVVALSEQLKFPPAFVLDYGCTDEEDGMGVPYHREDGSLAATRVLTRLEPRSYAWKDEPADYPFGLDCIRKAEYFGFVVVADREIDALVGRYHGLPVLASPEYHPFRPEWYEHLDRAGRVFLAVDLERERNGLIWELAHTEFADGVYLMYLGSSRSLADLHVEGPADFPSRWLKAQREAIPLLSTPYWKYRSDWLPV